MAHLKSNLCRTASLFSLKSPGLKPSYFLYTSAESTSEASVIAFHKGPLDKHVLSIILQIYFWVWHVQLNCIFRESLQVVLSVQVYGIALKLYLEETHHIDGLSIIFFRRGNEPDNRNVANNTCLGVLLRRGTQWQHDNDYQRSKERFHIEPQYLVMG